MTAPPSSLPWRAPQSAARRGYFSRPVWSTATSALRLPLPPSLRSVAPREPLIISCRWLAQSASRVVTPRPRAKARQQKGVGGVSAALQPELNSARERFTSRNIS